MSLIKLAISSAPARLAMQKTIANQAGSKASALYAAASSRAAGGAKDKVTKGLFNQLKANGVQRANPLASKLSTAFPRFQQNPLALATV